MRRAILCKKCSEHLVLRTGRIFLSFGDRMNYSTLGIMMHKKCNAECDICSVNCSPSSEEELDVERLKEFIGSCVGTSIQYVSFTGGEPFLRYHELCDLVLHTSQCGLVPSVVTNGFWAKDISFTKKRIKELKQCGIKKINISYDYHHLKFVPAQNVNHIAICCEQEGISYSIASTKLKDEKIGALFDSIDSGLACVNYVVSNCQPVGRAKNNYPQQMFSKTIPNHKINCNYGGIVTVYFDGRVFPCCSHYVFGTNLFVGHYSYVNIPQLLEKIKNNSLLYCLRNFGMISLCYMSRQKLFAL